MRVGIKFYPKGYKPEHVVTSHRIRTGLGNDWVLNRERVEDLLLRAGAQDCRSTSRRCRPAR